MYNTSKGNYSVKLNKVIEKFNLKNLTPEVDTKKIVIRQTDVNRPALQFAGYFEYFDYSRIQLIGKVEYSYLKMHDDDYIREMTEKIFKAGIPCMIFCRGLEPRPLFMELGNKYGVPVLATDDGTSSFFSEDVYKRQDVVCTGEKQQNACLPGQKLRIQGEYCKKDQCQMSEMPQEDGNVRQGRCADFCMYLRL